MALQDAAQDPDLIQSTQEALGDVTDQATEWVEMAQELAVTYGPRLVAALVVFIVGRFIVKLLCRLLVKVMGKRGMDETIQGFLVNLLNALGLTLVLLSAVQTLGVETTSFVAILGAATLAIGFALQGSLGNFASGVMLLIFRPFKKGDFIEAGGAMGSVDALAVFATTLKTPDNKVVIVPNSSITGGTITNFSTMPTRRVDMVMGVSYDDDLQVAKQTIERVVKADERVLAEPAPTIAVAELGDSSVNIVVRPWCNSGDYWGVKFDLTEKLKVELEAAGCSIPYPQRDVHNYTPSAGA